MTDAVAKLRSLLPVCASGPPTDSPRSHQLSSCKSLTKAADKLGRLLPCNGGRALVSSQTGGRRAARVRVGRHLLGMVRVRGGHRDSNRHTRTCVDTSPSVARL